MVIEIGAVKTLSVENWEVTPGDRQARVETVDGVVVQDFGYFPDGDNFSCTVKLRAVDVDIIFNYWHNRTRVNVIDEAGNILENMRVVVKKYSYVPHFCNYLKINLEFWRV